MNSEEIIAAILHFSNFALAAIAVGLCIMLFRHHRNCGWLVLAGAFLSPFAILLLRIAHGRPLLTYRSVGPVVNGVAQVTYRWEFPCFYAAVVAALIFLVRDTRPRK